MKYWERADRITQIVTEVLLFLILCLGIAAVIYLGTHPLHQQAQQEPPGDSNSKADYNAIPDHDYTWYDVVSWHDMCNVVAIEDLHPKSLGILSLWAQGFISDQQFQVMFSLPNSDYLGTAECIIRNRDTPRYWKPQA